MTHHHTLPGPMPGKLPCPTTDRPTSAGEWLYIAAVPVGEYGGLLVKLMNPMAYPDAKKCTFGWYERSLPRRVLVTETPGAGRLCRELHMGGSAQCGFADWSGEWRKP